MDGREEVKDRVVDVFVVGCFRQLFSFSDSALFKCSWFLVSCDKWDLLYSVREFLSGWSTIRLVKSSGYNFLNNCESL